ncbi:hypothetical protein [Psychrobacter sp. I-STPA10]|uniref:hypothetical protein n=1 Tax=Psychrobacter sp. I-STPA10 TaxID=2585769 RepID=UPI001E423E9D|nr:hypothetical protein [Psychrobacter sp. I-STPA10]
MKYTQHNKRKLNRLTLAVISLLSAMALTACGGGGGGSDTPSNSGNNGSGNGGNNGGGNNPNPTPTQPVINELVVTTLNDVVNAKDDVNSLREAVAYAKNNGGTITFKNDLKGTITLKNQIDIVQGRTIITIEGRGDDIKIDGNGKTRLFNIQDSSVDLNNLVLQNASIPSNDLYKAGAAIHVKQGQINLNNVKLLNNDANQYQGGAIFAQDSSISITGGEIMGNTAFSGGAIYNKDATTLYIDGVKFENNVCASTASHEHCYGGAIAHLGRKIDINNATFSNNMGGRVINKSDGSASWGGAIFLDLNYGLTKADSTKAGNATITNSTFSNNVVGLSSADKSTLGGAIMINSDLYKQPNYIVTVKDSTFDGNISTNGDGGAIYLDDGNTLNITDSKFTNNQAQKYVNAGGGAIRISQGNLSIKDSSFIGNKATGGTEKDSESNGGAIDAGTATQDKYTFNLDNITFKNNTTRISGGAVSLNDSYKSAVISNSTFEGNKTTNDVSEGGGLYVFGSGVEVKNTNFINNSSRWGGGIFVRSQNANLDTVTFKNNKVRLEGGGLYYVGGKTNTLTIKNITTAGNTSSDNSSLDKGEGIYCHCENVSNLGGHSFGDPNVGI